MSYLTINTDADPLFYSQSTQLEGIEYLLTFRWSERESCWYLLISDQDENPIAGDMKLVVGWPLLLRYTNTPGIPPGRLICIDMTGNNQEIQAPTDLNTRVLLTYITSDDPDVALIDQIASP